MSIEILLVQLGLGGGALVVLLFSIRQVPLLLQPFIEALRENTVAQRIVAEKVGDLATRTTSLELQVAAAADSRRESPTPVNGVSTEYSLHRKG